MPVAITGTDNNDLFTIEGTELEGSTIDGRGGEDVLELTGSYLGFNFLTMSSLTSVEVVRNTSQIQVAWFSSDQLSGILSFENFNSLSFNLCFTGDVVDLRNKTLFGSNIVIHAVKQNATIVTNDLEVAMAVRGEGQVGELLVLDGIVLTDSQRRAIHLHGIDRVQDATGLITKDLSAPSISGADSNIVARPDTPIQFAANVIISEDLALSSMLVLLSSTSFNETLALDQSGLVRITHDGLSDHILVNGRVIGQVTLSDAYIGVYFNADAVNDDAREILKNLRYQQHGIKSSVGPSSISIEVIDCAQNFTEVSIDVIHPNKAPTDILIEKNPIYETGRIDAWVMPIHVSDPNWDDEFTFALIDDAHGTFGLNQVANRTELILLRHVDFERQKSFIVTIRATDHGGLSVEKSLSITVEDDPNDGGLSFKDNLYYQTLYGTSGWDRIIGSDKDDKLLGLNGNDRLSGGNGFDDLFGGPGRDTLSGGAGVDRFVFDSKIASRNNKNVDWVRDFEPHIDVIILSKRVFEIDGHKALTSQAFWVGPRAHDTNDRIIYDKATGSLFYDSDGNGSHPAIKFAVLPAHLKMHNYDFYLVS